ncbi:uncharacterized protein VTP21DRAFT_7605 [Calcarisporiella thermophila]|uniref:uncharacterized protein n=1 Tax=Calcarisporiella thermophila TaxID=911321 RepID=UPI0037441A68
MASNISQLYPNSPNKHDLNAPATVSTAANASVPPVLEAELNSFNNTSLLSGRSQCEWDYGNPLESDRRFSEGWPRHLSHSISGVDGRPPIRPPPGLGTVSPPLQPDKDYSAIMTNPCPLTSGRPGHAFDPLKTSPSLLSSPFTPSFVTGSPQIGTLSSTASPLFNPYEDTFRLPRPATNSLSALTSNEDDLDDWERAISHIPQLEENAISAAEMHEAFYSLGYEPPLHRTEPQHPLGGPNIGAASLWNTDRTRTLTSPPLSSTRSSPHQVFPSSYSSAPQQSHQHPHQPQQHQQQQQQQQQSQQQQQQSQQRKTSKEDLFGMMDQWRRMSTLSSSSQNASGGMGAMGNMNYIDTLVESMAESYYAQAHAQAQAQGQTQLHLSPVVGATPGTDGWNDSFGLTNSRSSSGSSLVGSKLTDALSQLPQPPPPPPPQQQQSGDVSRRPSSSTAGSLNSNNANLNSGGGKNFPPRFSSGGGRKGSLVQTPAANGGGGDQKFSPPFGAATRRSPSLAPGWEQLHQPQQMEVTPDISRLMGKLALEDAHFQGLPAQKVMGEEKMVSDVRGWRKPDLPAGAQARVNIGGGGGGGGGGGSGSGSSSAGGSPAFLPVTGEILSPAALLASQLTAAGGEYGYIKPLSAPPTSPWPAATPEQPRSMPLKPSSSQPSRTNVLSSSTPSNKNNNSVAKETSDGKDHPSCLANYNLNPKIFNLKPANARYFVIKSYTEDDIHKSLKYGIWASTEIGNRRLDKAFQENEGKGPVYLFFSVNASGHFCGMGQMLTAVDYSTNSTVWAQDKWKGVFNVRWIFVKDVPNAALRHIRVVNNDNKPVTNSRDTQELLPEAGREVLRILFEYKSRTSILDDFEWYDARQQSEGRGNNTEAKVSHV